MSTSTCPQIHTLPPTHQLNPIKFSQINTYCLSSGVTKLRSPPNWVWPRFTQDDLSGSSKREAASGEPLCLFPKVHLVRGGWALSPKQRNHFFWKEQTHKQSRDLLILGRESWRDFFLWRSLFTGLVRKLCSNPTFILSKHHCPPNFSEREFLGDVADMCPWIFSTQKLQKIYQPHTER